MLEHPFPDAVVEALGLQRLSVHGGRGPRVCGVSVHGGRGLKAHPFAVPEQRANLVPSCP